MGFESSSSTYRPLPRVCQCRGHRAQQPARGMKDWAEPRFGPSRWCVSCCPKEARIAPRLLTSQGHKRVV